LNSLIVQARDEVMSRRADAEMWAPCAKVRRTRVSYEQIAAGICAQWRGFDD
jgi:hypothetical protein